MVAIGKGDPISGCGAPCEDECEEHCQLEVQPESFESEGPLELVAAAAAAAVAAAASVIAAAPAAAAATCNSTTSSSSFHLPGRIRFTSAAVYLFSQAYNVTTSMTAPSNTGPVCRAAYDVTESMTDSDVSCLGSLGSSASGGS